jgi:Family of unknown function (DUF5995)
MWKGIEAMFPYDAQLGDAAGAAPSSIPAVLQTLETIENLCVDADGLKWFNWLYLTVTQAVESRVAAGGFNDSAWLAALDVQFANLYFNALSGWLSSGSCPGCWQAMFSCRGQSRIARIQFALAGMNAHINRDLPFAIVATCKATNTVPQHGTAQYNDYSAINATLNGIIETAKQTLHVRLLGDPLPAVSQLDDLIAAWNLAAAREQAWITAESLWHEPALIETILTNSIDGLTTVIGKALLVPVL